MQMFNKTFTVITFCYLIKIHTFKEKSLIKYIKKNKLSEDIYNQMFKIININLDRVMTVKVIL